MPARAVIGSLMSAGVNREPLVTWPSGKASADLATLADRAREGIGFVRNRHDLCELLMQVGDVTRGSWHAEASWAGYAGRLVKAILLAESLGSKELEAQARHRLHTAPEPPFDHLDNVLDEAKVRAKRFGKELRRDIRI